MIIFFQDNARETPSPTSINNSSVYTLPCSWFDRIYVLTKTSIIQRQDNFIYTQVCKKYYMIVKKKKKSKKQTKICLYCIYEDE